MISRGQIPKNQLLFEVEIERATKRNRKTKTKERRGDTREESSTTSFPSNIFQEENNMVEEQTPSAKRTLGDYGMHQGPRHFFSIAIPTTTKALKMKPAFLSLISTHQFTIMNHEDPYTHLATFYELVGTIGFQSGDIENVYMHLFPFSLEEKAKECHPNQSLTWCIRMEQSGNWVLIKQVDACFTSEIQVELE